MNREEYAAASMALYNRPAGRDHPKQKFPRGARIHVNKEMPPSMRHFESDFDGIVEYTYAQKYGGNNVDSYCIVVLDKKGRPIDSISWYHEHQLTLISDDIAAGLAIIEAYRLG